MQELPWLQAGGCSAGCWPSGAEVLWSLGQQGPCSPSMPIEQAQLVSPQAAWSAAAGSLITALSLSRLDLCRKQSHVAVIALGKQTNL